MLETGAGIMAIVTAVLGMIVGCGRGQSVAIRDDERSLARLCDLLAIGFSRWKLMAVVVVQALSLGMTGILIGSYFFGRAASLSQTTPLPLELTPEIFGGVLAALWAAVPWPRCCRFVPFFASIPFPCFVGDFRLWSLPCLVTI